MKKNNLYSKLEIKKEGLKFVASYNDKKVYVKESKLYFFKVLGNDKFRLKIIYDKDKK